MITVTRTVRMVCAAFMTNGFSVGSVFGVLRKAFRHTVEQILYLTFHKRRVLRLVRQPDKSHIQRTPFPGGVKRVHRLGNYGLVGAVSLAHLAFCAVAVNGMVKMPLADAHQHLNVRGAESGKPANGAYGVCGETFAPGGEKLVNFALQRKPLMLAESVSRCNHLCKISENTRNACKQPAKVGS